MESFLQYFPPKTSSTSTSTMTNSVAPNSSSHSSTSTSTSTMINSVAPSSSFPSSTLTSTSTMTNLSSIAMKDLLAKVIGPLLDKSAAQLNSNDQIQLR